MNILWMKLYQLISCWEELHFLHSIHLTLSWWGPLSYRNQSTDLQSKSMDWFLYDNGLRHERVKTYALTTLSKTLKSPRSTYRYIKALLHFWKYYKRLQLGTLTTKNNQMLFWNCYFSISWEQKTILEI